MFRCSQSCKWVHIYYEQSYRRGTKKWAYIVRLRTSRYYYYIDGWIRFFFVYKLWNLYFLFLILTSWSKVQVSRRLLPICRLFAFFANDKQFLKWTGLKFISCKRDILKRHIFDRIHRYILSINIELGEEKYKKKI